MKASKWSPPESVPCMDDPELFTGAIETEPPKDPDNPGQRLPHPELAEAKRICQEECKFLNECLEGQMEAEGMTSTRYRSSVYGGLSPLERNRLADYRKKYDRPFPRKLASIYIRPITQ